MSPSTSTTDPRTEIKWASSKALEVPEVCRAPPGLPCPFLSLISLPNSSPFAPLLTHAGGHAVSKLWDISVPKCFQLGHLQKAWHLCVISTTPNLGSHHPTQSRFPWEMLSHHAEMQEERTDPPLLQPPWSFPKEHPPAPAATRHGTGGVFNKGAFVLDAN